ASRPGRPWCCRRVRRTGRASRDGPGGGRVRTSRYGGAMRGTVPPNRRLWRSLLVCAALVLPACGGPSGSPGPLTGGELDRVTKVTDGDTIHVLVEGRDERVRLI